MMLGSEDTACVVHDALADLDVPESILTALPPFTGVRAVMVYGSRARGDATEDSDLDLLALVPRARASVQSGDVHCSYYTQEQLTAGSGTLFGAHLQRDGRVLWDPTGDLTIALRGMGEVDTDRLFARVTELSQLFTTPQWDLPTYLPGLLREARYLLRSCLYAIAIADGDPCFSVRELATRHNNPDLSRLLASRHAEPPSERDYQDCLCALSTFIGPFPPSIHGSLEATVVNEWGLSSDLLSLAVMALKTSQDDVSDYSEIEKILL